MNTLSQIEQQLLPPEHCQLPEKGRDQYMWQKKPGFSEGWFWVWHHMKSFTWVKSLNPKNTVM